MKNYFSHDEGARNDPKLIKVLMKLGQAGKGVYWDLIEMLYEQNGYLLLSECESYAFALRTENDLMQSLLMDFGLFENDGEKFWSASLLRRLKTRQEKSKKAAESAQKRWNNANAMRTHSKGNANKVKESKVKEKKDISFKEKVEKELSVLPDADRERWFKFTNWFQNQELEFVLKVDKQLTPKQLVSLLENFGATEIKDAILRMENYKGSKNYQSVYLTINNWLKREAAAA